MHAYIYSLNGGLPCSSRGRKAKAGKRELSSATATSTRWSQPPLLYLPHSSAFVLPTFLTSQHITPLFAASQVWSSPAEIPSDHSQTSSLLSHHLTYCDSPTVNLPTRIEMTDYASLKVPDLKKLLQERGLQQSGNKADLIARLQDNDKSTPNSNPDSALAARP